MVSLTSGIAGANKMGDLKAGLQKWAETNEISPADFSRVTGYSYNHSYQLLRGDAAVTTEVIGKLVMAYGLEAAAEVLQGEDAHE